jgi:hypothetical protein
MHDGKIGRRSSEEIMLETTGWGGTAFSSKDHSALEMRTRKQPA